MVGYPEALTDPSYRGQILVLTFPLIGNYGVPDEAIEDAYGLPKYFESREIHIAGLVVAGYSWEHSHWAAQKSLAAWLQANNVPGIYGVDTRALTIKIRDAGAMLGNLVVVSGALEVLFCVWGIRVRGAGKCRLGVMFFSGEKCWRIRKGWGKGGQSFLLEGNDLQGNASC